jgi:hypothetical protein
MLTNGYTTVAALKTRLGNIADDRDDAKLEQIIEAASREIDGLTNRVFYTVDAQAQSTNLTYVIERIPVTGTVTAAYLMVDAPHFGTTATAWRLDIQRAASTGGEFTTMADVDFVTGVDIEAQVEFPMVLASAGSLAVTEGQYVYVWNRVGVNSEGTPRCLVVLVIEPA